MTFDTDCVFVYLFTPYVYHRPLLPPFEPFRPLPIGALCFYANNLGSGGLLPAEHPHEDELHHVAVEEKELCPAVSLRPVDRLHTACRRGRGVGEQDVFQRTELAEFSALPSNRVEGTAKDGGLEGKTHKKESIGQKCICKDSPPYPPSCPIPTVQYLSYDQRDNNANKFVSRIRDEVE